MTHVIRNALVIVLAVLGGNVFAHKVSDPSKFVTTSVSVIGAVEHKLTLTVDDLKKFPQQQLPEVRIINHEGATTATLRNVKAVLLRDILDRAKIHAPDHSDVKKIAIIVSASDDYKAVYSWGEVFNSTIGDGVIVFFENDGKPLDDNHGRIAMVSTKDTKKGMRHVRWLKSLEVRKITD